MGTREANSSSRSNRWSSMASRRSSTTTARRPPAVRGAADAQPHGLAAPGISCQSEAYRSLLRALAARAGDGVGGRLDAELGLQAREPLAHGVQAEEQLPGDVRLVVDRRRRVQDLGLARAEPEPAQRLGPESGKVLLEEQRVWIARQQMDGQAAIVAHANERRARR